MTDLLNITNVTISLPKGGDRKNAVNNVNIGLKSGEITCIVGESGSGKSTIAHAILGLLPRGLKVTEGSITFRDIDLTKQSTKDLRKIRGKQIGMIFQEPLSALNPVMRCDKQIKEVLIEHSDLNKEQLQQRVQDILISVGLTDYQRIANSYPYELSGGQRQRVMIAMALALEPDILIADEPTTALDVTTQAQILQLIKKVQASKNLGVLFITHDFGVVSEIADNIIVMKDGIVVEADTAKNILNNPQEEYTKDLLAAVPSFTPPDNISTNADSTDILQVKELHKTYVRKGGLFSQKQYFSAVNNVSFSIKHGETIGLVGESGSGKSTIGRILSGLIPADSGSILFNDIELLKENAFKDPTIRRSIQMIFQDPYGSLNPRRSVAQILTGGIRLYGLSKKEANNKAKELMATVSLDPNSLDRFPHEFSGGQRQRIGFARAIAITPNLIIADEPVSALDVSVQSQILGMLRSLKEKFNLSMMFITHDLRVAAQLCDRIIVLKNGQAVEQGEAKDILLNPQHEYTRELIRAVPGRSWK